MRKFTITMIVMCSMFTLSNAQNLDNQIKDVQREIKELKTKQTSTSSIAASNKQQIGAIESKIKLANSQLDSLESKVTALNDEVNAAKAKLSSDIEATNKDVASKEQTLSSSIENKAFIGAIALLIVAAIGALLFMLLRKKMSGNDDVVENIKNVQNELQKAQKSLEEESVKLDNQLVKILERQVNAAPVQAAPDHSLALKVADEITRMEVNLSRMDKSIKGHKQLTKAVERIKNNFSAKGYEITELLGKPYVEGMKVIANFVPDETIPEGSQIITSIIKPQILFNGKLIQAAEITVSQNI